MKTILDISKLDVSYDRIQVIYGISLVVYDKEIVSMIGANGAGKTTSMRAIMGSASIGRESKIRFYEKEIGRWPPHRIVRAGVGLVPEGRRLFPDMSVRENLEMGAYFTNQRESFNESLEHVLSVFPILEERLDQLGRTLSGGEQQMLAVGRALMSRPRLLLMDEPSLGLAPMVVASIFKVIKEINGEGTAILLVEQNARMALRLSHRGYILETGKITKKGECKALLNDESVQQAYLGKKRVHNNNG